MNVKNRDLFIILATAALFFAVTLPCRTFFQVLPVTEVRPASAFNPVFGLLFGPAGALGCALGNLAADAVSGYGLVMCVLGFFVQLLYGLVPWAVWQRLGGAVRLDTSAKVLRYMLLILLDSALTATLLGALMQLTHTGTLVSMATLMLFLNNFVFCMVLGIPILLFFTGREIRRGAMKTSLNERFVLIFLVLSLLSAAMIGFIAYYELSGQITDMLALWNRVYIYISLNLFVFCFVIILVLRYAEKNITVPMDALACVAADYIGAENDAALDTASIRARCDALARTPGEAGALAAAFRDMTANLEQYIDNLTRITAEKERISAELDVAQKIQADLLPSVFPAIPERSEFDIYASMTPAKEVGGDFYDFFLIDDNHLALVIADVSDKGVPAALFMVISKTLIKNQALMGRMPAEILEEVNNQLCENNKEKMFVTVWLGILEISTGTLTCANAGHEYPMLSQDGAPFALYKDKHGLVLAGMRGMKYRQYSLTLRPGDALFVYTDGVPEASDNEKAFFGSERTLAALNEAPGGSAQALIRRVHAAIDGFSAGAPQFDDITMLALRFHGAPAKEETLTVSARVENWPRVLAWLEDFLARHDAAPKACMQLSVACEEIFVNIASYAYPDGAGEAEMTLSLDEETRRLTLTFRDSGMPYNPLEAAEPDVTLRPEARRKGGLGLLMVKRTMDSVQYAHTGGKNNLTLEKDI